MRVPIPLGSPPWFRHGAILGPIFRTGSYCLLLLDPLPERLVERPVELGREILGIGQRDLPAGPGARDTFTAPGLDKVSLAHLMNGSQMSSATCAGSGEYGFSPVLRRKSCARRNARPATPPRSPRIGQLRSGRRQDPAQATQPGRVTALRARRGQPARRLPRQPFALDHGRGNSNFMDIREIQIVSSRNLTRSSGGVEAQTGVARPAYRCPCRHRGHGFPAQAPRSREQCPP
jgi:hypothetical protein